MEYDLSKIKTLWNSIQDSNSCNKVSFDIAFGAHSHYVKRNTIKRFLVSNCIVENKCSICDTYEWLGNPLVLQLDHIDGDRHNNQLHNLRLLCPNCHTQTETFSKRKPSYSGKDPKSNGDIVKAITTSRNARQALIKLGLQPYGGNYDRIRKCMHESKVQFNTGRQAKVPMHELLDQLCKYSIKEIGDLHGVSDNAVRKWMKSYKIPHTRSELREFITSNGMEYDVKWRIDSSNVKRGESVASVKLTEDIVRAIKSHHYDGYSVRSIAKQFNVSHGTISAILNGRSWCHVK